MMAPMVTEIADITVHADSGDGVDAAFGRGVAHLAGAAGFGGARLNRSIETPERFVLLVEWDDVAAHEGFRSSPAFAEWRAEMGPFFARPPVVEHFTEVGRSA